MYIYLFIYLFIYKNKNKNRIALSNKVSGNIVDTQEKFSTR